MLSIHKYMNNNFTKLGLKGPPAVPVYLGSDLTVGFSFLLFLSPSSPLSFSSPPRLMRQPFVNSFFPQIQSGASSHAKNGGAYFSNITGSIQDPIAVPGPCEVTEP